MTGHAIGAGFRERRIRADGFEIRLFEAGEGDPLLVLHGAGGPAFTRALDLLAEGRRVILVELPGFGEQPNERHRDLADVAVTLDAVAESLGLDAVDVLGTSMGGAVALRFALDVPSRVAHLVLDAPAVFRVGGVSPAVLSPERLRSAFRRHPERPPAWQPAPPEKTTRVWPLVERLVGSTPEHDGTVAARLRDYAGPVLVLFGEHDPIVPSGNAPAYTENLPDVVCVALDAAHDIQSDQPDRFAQLVGDFLAGRPLRSGRALG